MSRAGSSGRASRRFASTGRGGSIRRPPVGAEVRLAEAGAEDVAVRLVGPALDPLAGLHGQAARADRSCPLDARRQENGLSAATAKCWAGRCSAEPGDT